MNLNIKYLFTIMLVGLLMYSCSEDGVDAPSPGATGTDLPIKLSISLANSLENELPLRSWGNPSVANESKIYSLEVLIFKSADGTLDGYKSSPRQVISVTGQYYNRAYATLDSILGINLTAGLRDIYVVANAPDNYFAGVTTLAAYKAKSESLLNQGLYEHPGGPYQNEPELPIGGLDPSSHFTNLTMCGVMKNVQFNNLHTQHYLGYTTNGGRPTGVSTGWPLNGVSPFYVERLAARIAIKKITFDFPSQLDFGGGETVTAPNYVYTLDSVFVVNAKSRCKFYDEDINNITGNFFHGDSIGYARLKGAVPGIFLTSVIDTLLVEPLNGTKYDIQSNDSPVWFYAFENKESATYPTYFVVTVVFDYISPVDGKPRTVKSYYPIVVNKNGMANGASHNFIKRNNQYGINVVIKNVGPYYNPSFKEELRSVTNLDLLPVEVDEVVGTNLFPWTGNVYK